MDRNTIKNQEIKGKLIGREVYYCVSSLVYELAQKAKHFPDYEEDLYSAFQGEPDFEEAASQQGWMVENGQFENESGATSDAESWEELCEEENIDYEDYRSDIYEHWLVSDWFANKLEEHGHKVLKDFFGLTVWCRPTTGQAILLDGVISDIAEEMEILEGQVNAWL